MKLRTSLIAVPLVGMMAVLTVHLTVGIGERGLADPAWKIAYNGLIFACALVCFLAAPRAERLAWGLLGLGITSWAIGNTYWTFALVDLESPPYPSIADAFWLAFYPPVIAALVLLVRSRVSSYRLSLWVDGLIGGLAVAAVATSAVFGRILETDAGGLLGTLTNLAYPLADMLLVALVAGALALTGWRADRVWAALALGFVVFGVSDSVYLYQVAVGSYTEGTLVDLGWPTAATIFALAACGKRRRLSTESSNGWLLLGLPALFAGVGLGVLVYDHFKPVTPLALVLASASVVAVIGRMAMTFGENRAILARRTIEAETDALTGLGNRRRLLLDLAEELDGEERRRLVLVLFDLNGFKHYNDTYGHPAGDVLLARVGRSLAAFAGTRGTAYRMGGDEFCAIFERRGEQAEGLVAAAAQSLAEEGDGFSISASYGYLELPDEASDATEALRVADQRMYANKASSRLSASEQSSNVLVAALAERHTDLRRHLDRVAELAEAVARALGLSEEEIGQVRVAAALHDVGKMAIPDAILGKFGPLNEADWAFVRRHTMIGETIMHAAPALRSAARLVRSTHERFDGLGYPDGLAGEAIPLGSRIIFVCDAFDAMRSPRPYSRERTEAQAFEELRLHAGSQFDPVVVEAFERVLEQRRRSAAA